MSEDKKRDRALQRRVRERQEKTGESYQAAWRQLTGSEAPSPDELSVAEQDSAVVLEHAEHLRRVNTQMFDGTIRVLGHQNQNLQERVETLTKELEDARAEKLSTASQTLHLRFDELRVLPHQPTRVTARAEQAVDIEHIDIMGGWGLDRWVVNDIEIDGRSQLTTKDLPGELFGYRGVAAAKRGLTKLSLEGFDPVERGRELTLVVTYVGPNPEGCPLFASAVGSKPRQRPTIIPIASKDPILVTQTKEIRALVQNARFQLERLEISDEGTLGGPADWIVNDLCINGRSQFQPGGGDIPGDLFATKAIDTFVKFETCEAGSALSIFVTYIGLKDEGVRFAASLEGTVLRDDYSVAPPDLYVLIEAGGEGPGGTMVATCDWRAPATDNCTR